MESHCWQEASVEHLHNSEFEEEDVHRTSRSTVGMHLAPGASGTAVRG